MPQSVHLVCPHCDAVNRLPWEKLDRGGKCGKCKSSLFTGKPLEVTEENFDKHLGRNDIPVIVDFWAPWCGPCKMFAPVFEQAAKELEPAVRLVKVNTENAPAVAGRMGIRSIPTLALFRNGQEVDRKAGAMDLRGFLRWVESQTG